MVSEETVRCEMTSSQTVRVCRHPVQPVVHFVCYDGCSFEAVVNSLPRAGGSVRAPNGRRYTVLTVHRYAVPFEYDADGLPRREANAVCGPFKP
jgi:hypothetical protein